MNISQMMPFLKENEKKIKINCAMGAENKYEPLSPFLKGRFKEWQEDQDNKNFNREYILSLAYMNKGEWLFAGIYETISVKEITEGERVGKLTYETKLNDVCQELIGRLVVSFEKSFRASYLNCEEHCDDLTVSEIKKRKQEYETFPGYSDMIEVYKQVAAELFRVFDRNSPLHFPKYFNNDDKEFRISEQESKLILSNLFFENKTPFAVEVPTETKHSFTGNVPKSARYDLVTYEEGSYRIKYVIELKAHNPEEGQIRKDIEKFACSDLDCIWFHTLAKADLNTYRTLLKKINHAIEKEREKIVGSHKWDFVIAVLETKELYVYSEIISKEHIINLDTINCFSKIEL